MNKKEIVEQIKNSRKYSGIALGVIERETQEFINKNPAYNEYNDKFILKQIKEKLHKAYGSFQTSKKGKIGRLLEKLAIDKNNEYVRDILNTNLSARERLKDYGFIYGKIFEITGKPNSILDLGCGLNPLSYPYMQLDEDFKYYAYDINEKDLDIIRKFFLIYKVDSHVSPIDMKNIKQVKKLPSADLIFMFKALDPLEKSEKGHKLAEEIITILINKTKFMVVSFATKTLSGKKMNFPQRGWIEMMLSRIGLRYESFKTENEIFYIISEK